MKGSYLWLRNTSSLKVETSINYIYDDRILRFFDPPPPSLKVSLFYISISLFSIVDIWLTRPPPFACQRSSWMPPYSSWNPVIRIFGSRGTPTRPVVPIKIQSPKNMIFIEFKPRKFSKISIFKFPDLVSRVQI